MVLAEYAQRRWYQIGRYIVILAILVVVTVWICTAPTVSSAADQLETTYFHSGWTQQVGDEEIPLDNIHDYISVDEGESLVFACTLPEIKDGQVFLFYSVNKEVRCYVDDQLIQSFTMQEGYTFLDTPGSAWNQVDLTSDMSGKTCTIVFTSPLGQYNSLGNIYFIADQYVNTVRMDCCNQAIISICMVGFIMLVTFLTAIFTKQVGRRRYMLSIGQYFLVVFARLLAEVNAFDLVFGRPVLSYVLGEIFLRLLPLALLYLAKNSTNQYWHPQIFKALHVAAWGNLLIPLALQFALGISLLELEMLHQFVAALVDVTLLLIIAEKLFRFKRLKYEEYFCLALPVLVIGGGIDTFIALYNRIYYPFAGVWTGVGAIVFAIVVLVISTHIHSKRVQEQEKLTQDYHELENVILGKQLEAHFIFNVLNSISAYCKTDPEEADRAIISFASYLRDYLHHMHQRDNIPFAQELSLVEDYLILQQMRFGEDLCYHFDAEYLDFDVPPFSIYTMVENSVIHGIQQSDHGGEVTISAVKADGFIQVVILDTGVGFDTTIPVKETSVGVSNTKRRFELMKNATVAIESEIGVGTKVTVTIPGEH